MTTWRPQLSPARFILPAAVLLCVLALVWLARALLDRNAVVQLDMGVFLLGVEFLLVLVLAVALLYLSWCAFSIRYRMDADRLTIERGGVRFVVLLESITQVFAPGDKVDEKGIAVRWRGVPPFIPGYVVSGGKSAQLGRVACVATLPVQRQVFIKASGIAFGISPQNSTEFIEQLEKARQEVSGLLQSEEAPLQIALSGLNAWATRVWSDKLARRLLIAGLVLNVLFFGYLSLVYGDLPSRLPLHWNAQAEIDRIGPPVELLSLPIFAAAAWLVSALAASWTLRKERAISIFLLGGAAATQVVFMAGALSIVLRAI